MATTEHRKDWFARSIHLSNNWLTFLGIILTTTGGVCWLFLLPLQIGGEAVNPYMGILFFLLLPALFFAGLLLMPLGIWWRLRAERRRGAVMLEIPPISWRNPQFRRVVSLVGIATFANLLIGGHYTYAAVEYMDSVSFCGQTCHTVMKPEFTAYQESPHFRVTCTECHVGAGASSYLRSKLNGVHQLFAVAFNDYSKPIEQPVHNLRPARETCEQCHWPQRFNPYQLRIIDKYAEDEQNTHGRTVLMMRLARGEGKGIHGFHLQKDARIEFRSDRSRQTIPWVRYTSPAGESVEYAAADWDPAKADEYEQRTMDCFDCHNRPAHTFTPADRALDRAMAAGSVALFLPGAKAKGLEIIRVGYASTAEGEQRIPKAFEEFYQQQHPDVYAANRETVEKSARGLLAVWERNVFPEMNITWGTYVNHDGHTDFPGCFRCHDDSHTSPQGKTIGQDCSSCHDLLALEEQNPEILQQLGLDHGQ